MQNGFRFDVRCVMPAKGFFFASWSALGGLRGRKKVLLIGSWPVQEEFQDRFHPKGGPKWDPFVLYGPLFLGFQVGIRNRIPIGCHLGAILEPILNNF